MKIIAMEVGYIATNCYIVVNEETHHGVIIDPGGDAARIMEAVQKENLTVDAIFFNARPRRPYYGAGRGCGKDRRAGVYQ